MVIESLDHLVLTVADLKATCSFYAEFGMTVQTSAEGRLALAFGTQKINLHQLGHEFEPKAGRPTPGSGDLCFLTKTPLPEIIKHLGASRITIIEGPVQRSGAAGPIISVYVRDPDGNLVEISNSVGV